MEVETCCESYLFNFQRERKESKSERSESRASNEQQGKGNKTVI